MSKAYYNNGGSFKECTPDLVGALGSSFNNMSYVSLSNTADWNSLTSGIYYVGWSSWPSNKNCPTDAYPYGILICFTGGSGNITQVYIAHNDSQFWWRERWSSSNGFTNWNQMITNKNIGSQSVNYATSSGVATSANKLNTNAGSSTQPVYFSNGIPVAATAYSSANVNGAKYNTNGFAYYVTQSTSTSPYKRLAYFESAGNWVDASMICAIDCGYNGGPFGIFKVAHRNDNISTGASSYSSVVWLARNGYNVDQLLTKTYSVKSGTNYTDLYFKANGTYNSVNIRVLNCGNRGGDSMLWTLDSSSAPRAAADIRTYSTTNNSTDGGYVSSAGSAINEYAVAVSSSAPTDSRTKLWIQT